MEDLAQHELERFRHVAWAAYHGGAEPHVWHNAVLRALAIRKREQSIAMDAEYWRQASRN
jgi:hypothetical protein